MLIVQRCCYLQQTTSKYFVQKSTQVAARLISRLFLAQIALASLMQIKGPKQARAAAKPPSTLQIARVMETAASKSLHSGPFKLNPLW